MRAPSPAADSFERGGRGLSCWTLVHRACGGERFAEVLLRISIAVWAQSNRDPACGIRNPESGIRREVREIPVVLLTSRQPDLQRSGERQRQLLAGFDAHVAEFVLRRQCGIE